MQELFCHKQEAFRRYGCLRKRGGARVIYLYLQEYSIVFFLFVYPKNEAENLTMKQKQYLKKLSHEIRKTIPNSQYA